MIKICQIPTQKVKPARVLALNAPGLNTKSIISFSITFWFLLFIAFVAKGQTLTLLSPNGGEEWMNNTTQIATWEWDGDDTDIYLQYSPDNGTNWYLLGDAAASAGSFSFVAAFYVSETTKIRVTSYNNENLTDESDDYFLVIENPVNYYTPMPGDEFYPTQTAQLSWDSFTFFNCNVSVSTDGGENWTQLETNWPLDFYDWTVPNIYSDECVLKISDVNDTSVYGLSINFSIAEQPTATFTSPVGGETWTFGEDANISWTGNNIPNYVYFDYSVDAGQTWENLGYAESEPSGGSVDFGVPRENTSNAKIRMVNSNYDLVIGETEEPFTIYTPPIIIYFLNGGEEFYAGSMASIIWVVNGVDFVNIELSRDNGENWEMVAANLDADIYTYTWAVSGSPSDECRIKISDVSDPATFDISGQFSILEAPVISLIEPNGNVVWKSNKFYTISWVYDNPEFSEVNAEYSIDGGASWDYIGYGLPAQGSIDWKTPDVESEECLIRVFDFNFGFVADTSDLFAIRDFPDTPICIVSVDSATNRNVIIWEKPDSDMISDFILYKESNQANIFEPIATVPYDGTPSFTDPNSNPSIKSYRYKLGFSDGEGYVYPMGELHQTIHLTISQGIGNAWNLNWGAYIGFDVASYNIYRSDNGADYVKIETISSSFFSYTDIDAPGGDVYYYIEVVNENACSLSTKDLNINSAISNIVTNIITDLETLDAPLISNIYPNPSSQWINVTTGSETGDLSLQLFDLAGRMLLSEDYDQVNRNFQVQLNIAEIKNGIYFLHVNLGNFSEIRKVVIKH